MATITIDIPDGFDPERAKDAADEAVRIERRRMTEMRELFEREDVQRALWKVGKLGKKTTNVMDEAMRKQERAYGEVERRLRDFGFVSDDGSAYKEGCGAYMYGDRYYLTGSYDYAYQHPGKLTLNVHDGGGNPIETFEATFDKEYVAGLIAPRAKI